MHDLRLTGFPSIILNPYAYLAFPNLLRRLVRCFPLWSPAPLCRRTSILSAISVSLPRPHGYGTRTAQGKYLMWSLH
jgi:hypothetical protein